MAKQTRKILQKIKPKEEPKPEPQKKPGRDLILLAMIGLTVFILLFGWMNFSWLYRAMYVCLAFSLVLIYGQRQGKMADNIKVWMGRASLTLIIISFILFAVTAYQRFIA